MSKKHTYAFQFTVRDGVNVKNTIDSVIKLVSKVLGVPEVKYVGTLNCVATFTASSDVDPVTLGWQLVIEEGIRQYNHEHFSIMKTYYNFKEVGMIYIRTQSRVVTHTE